jgi:hypothetical protein
MNNSRKEALAVPREEWLDVTTELTAEFEEARESWFDQVVEFFEAVSQQEESPRYETPDLYPDAEVENSMRGYQLFVSLTLTATNQYIDREVFEDFADILTAQVCGADYFECMEYYNRFAETNDPEAWKRILGDVAAKMFDGSESGADHTELVREITPLLSIMTMMVTARSFGDDERVEEYTQMFDNFIGPPEGES